MPQPRRIPGHFLRQIRYRAIVMIQFHIDANLRRILGRQLFHHRDIGLAPIGAAVKTHFRPAVDMTLLQTLNKLYELQNEAGVWNICCREHRRPIMYITAYAASPGAMLFP